MILPDNKTILIALGTLLVLGLTAGEMRWNVDGKAFAAEAGYNALMVLGVVKAFESLWPEKKL